MFGGPLMWGPYQIPLLVLVALMFGIGALIKYLRS